MATAETRRPTSSGPLSHDEAAALIRIILANTSTSAPTRSVVPDSLKSLDDLFPVLAQAA